MIAVVSLIVVLVLSLVVVRVASVALMLTGLSKQLAGFQARSAFTGSGFTTSESEKVMQHPVRRRIIMTLMLLGNAGIITAVSSLILSFVSTYGDGLAGRLWFRVVLLVSGLAALWAFANSRWVDRKMSQWITTALKRWTRLEVVDYVGLLHLSGGYVVLEMAVQPGDWLADKRLSELNLFDEGVLVLGIQKPDGAYLGVPRGETVLQANDTVTLYGHKKMLCALDERRAGAAGNREHREAMALHEEIKDEAMAAPDRLGLSCSTSDNAAS